MPRQAETRHRLAARSADGLPEPSLGPSLSSLSAAEAGTAYFMDHGIDDDDIAPLEESWVQHSTRPSTTASLTILL